MSLLSAPSKVLLTGASSGIGAHLCDLLVERGHTVIALSRTARAMADRAGLIAVDCDLADPDAVIRAFGEIAEAHPDIRVAINNAAFQYGVPLTDPGFDPAPMAAEVAINLVAPALIAHRMLPAMLRSGVPSAFVNVSSGLAFFPKRNTALYCATKAGLHSFSQSLRYQLEGGNVRVIEAILPLVDTPMTAGRGSGKLDARDAARAILAGVASGRDEIYVGKARLLKILGGIAPALPRAILKRS